MAKKAATEKRAAKKERTSRPLDPSTRAVLLTLQHAAVITGVPYASLRKLVHGGHLQRVQLGESKRTWVKRVDVDRLIERSTMTQGE
jgi:hypothetical protein